MSRPSLTLVICTHNRVQLLERMLTSVHAADRPDDFDIDILIVANACTDDTETWLQQQSSASDETALPLTWLNQPIPGKSHALNLAIEHLTADYVALVDDDHRVPPWFFTAITDAFRSYPDTTMFCGVVKPDWDGREPHWIHDQSRYPIVPKPVPHFEPFKKPQSITSTDPIPGGGNLFFQRRVFDSVGGFSTELGPCGDGLGGSEDTDFVLRALNLGETMRYEPTILQYHYVELARLKLGYLMQKSFERSRSVTQVREDTMGGPPKYLWRKLASYSLKALMPLSLCRSRYYLVRMAATWGEIQAFKA